jgi:hypothetical protein
MSAALTLAFPFALTSVNETGGDPAFVLDLSHFGMRKMY